MSEIEARKTSVKSAAWLFWAYAAGAVAILGFLFFRSFLPGFILFNNDGPLGLISAKAVLSPGSFFGVWWDLNWLGNEGISASPTFSALCGTLLGPLGFAKFFCPITLLFVGLCAWFCFRRLQLAPLACFIGALAATLNADFFSTACWGVAAQIAGFGVNFLAIGFIADAVKPKRWSRIVLTGMAVGMGVMEAFDIGALFSMFVGAYVVYQALFLREDPAPSWMGLGQGVGRLAIVALFAALIATHSLSTLLVTQVQGVAGTQQNQRTKAERWTEATQWSVPKAEILQVLVPGLFGYRNEWHMYENEQPVEDQYWGTIGRGPGLPRLTGTGFYAGVMVVIVALWAILQSFRRSDSPFTGSQRRALWFWSAALLVSALLALGKHAPFYQLFYALPYASTIRNPIKFMHIFSWSLIIVFAYGLHGLAQAYMRNPVPKVSGLLAQFLSWRTQASVFDRKFLMGCLVALGGAVLGWLIYANCDSQLQAYLQTVNIPPALAPAVSAFSIHAVGWFVFFLTLTCGALALVFGGQFTGPRMKWGGILLGTLLVLDLGRADRPWIVYWSLEEKYTSDPIVKLLADKPYEHRVSLLPVPVSSPQQAMLVNAYGSDWKQHLFPYFNIQCAEVVQEPRVALEKELFMKELPPTNMFNILRFWEISNTRYLLGPGGDFVRRLDPTGNQFRVLESFDFVPKRPDAGNWPSDYSAVPNTNGQLAVLEFKGALPRAKLYSNWRVETNAITTVRTLASPAFDPQQCVLVDGVLPAFNPANTNQSAGSVSIKPNYHPKRVELEADVKTPAVLLLCDRFNPQWRVCVDGRPENLLRCNYIERGVFLEPGKHNIVFQYQTNLVTFLVSLATVGLGLILLAFMPFTRRAD